MAEKLWGLPAMASWRYILLKRMHDRPLFRHSLQQMLYSNVFRKILLAKPFMVNFHCSQRSGWDAVLSHGESCALRAATRQLTIFEAARWMKPQKQNIMPRQERSCSAGIYMSSCVRMSNLNPILRSSILPVFASKHRSLPARSFLP